MGLQLGSDISLDVMDDVPVPEEEVLVDAGTPVINFLKYAMMVPAPLVILYDHPIAATAVSVALYRIARYQ